MVKAVLFAVCFKFKWLLQAYTLLLAKAMPVFIVLNWSTPVIICFTSGSGRGGDNGELSLGYLTLKVMMGCPINTVRKLVE